MRATSVCVVVVSSLAACQGTEPLVPNRAVIEPAPFEDLVRGDSPLGDPRLDAPDGYERTVALRAYVLDANDGAPRIHVVDVAEERWVNSFDAPGNARSLAHTGDGALFVLTDDDVRVVSERDGALLDVRDARGTHVASLAGALVVAEGRTVRYVDEGREVQVDEDVLELFALDGRAGYLAGAYRDLHWELDPGIGCCAVDWVETFHVVSERGEDIALRSIAVWDPDVDGIGYRDASGSDGDVVVSVHAWEGDGRDVRMLQLTEPWAIDYELDRTSYTLLDDGVFARIEVPAAWDVVDVTAARE